MNKKGLIIFLGIILLTAFAAGFLFKDLLIKTYNNVGSTIKEFQTTDFGGALEQIKREVFMPSPLNIGGFANNTVLTKEKIIAQTNIQRFDNGSLPPVVENALLNKAALAKAQDMFAKQYFEHVSPTGLDPGTLVKNSGYDYVITGENLILGNFKNEADVVQHWMDSPGHRANILNDRFIDIGVAVIKGTYKGETVWIGVQEFGLPLSTCAEPDKTLKEKIEKNQATLTNMSVEIDAKKTEINSTNKNSPNYNQLVNEYNALVDAYNPIHAETKKLIVLYNNQIQLFNQCVEGT